MTVYEIATGYTSVPAKVGAATEIVVEELTKTFIKNSIDAKIIDMADPERAKTDLPIIEVKVPRAFVSEDTSLGIVHKLKRVVYSLALTKKLKAILRNANEKCVLHFHNQYNMFFFFKLVSKKLRKRALIAYTVHSGVWNLDWSESAQAIKKRYFQELFCMKNADVVFVLNDETKDNIINNIGVDENKIVRINNGVNTDIYHPLNQIEKNEILSKYALQDKKIILQVGSVCENKNQKRAVELLSDLLKKNENLVYVYVGGIVSQEYQNSISQTAKKLGIEEQVKYLGVMEPGAELNNLYNIASATIFSSDYEAFGMVVIESLSCGIPVFMSDNMHIDFGKGVILFNEESFVSKIDEYLNKPDDEQITKDARNNAENHYSWDIIAENYYNSMCDFLD